MTAVVVTGAGVIAPSGIGTEAYWSSTVDSELHVRPIEAFDASGYDTTIAGQVPGFRSEDYLDDRLAVQTDRWTWMALAATDFALADAGYDVGERNPYHTGVAFGSGSGGVEFGQREIQALWTQGRRAVSAYQSIAWFYAANTGQVSIKNGTKGPSTVLVTEGAGGLDSVGWARRAIRRGTPAVLAGGTEAPLCPYSLACQSASGRMTTSRDPRQGYKPFDAAANGYAPGEGGAVLVLEDAGEAARRGAGKVYAEVAGYAATHDAYHHHRPPGDCAQLARCMRLAIEDSGLSPDDIDLVIADGAGSPEFDALEVRAIRDTFGPRADRIPVTAPQGFIGRLCAGGSALNLVVAALVIRDGVIPAVGNLSDPDPGYGLDFVREPRRKTVETVLVNARGYGGFNSSVVLKVPALAQEVA
ncbi:beta-ketoacyl synthase N-terminal-like domain-containing protein [Amycolatopsis cynarae]|uniref:Beta-ketoacyl synthase N-terminal-like domain-containing protein n=1 Tax=Amycolatopsis cynarae TaxID=2995223 RepID=A0ABY7AUQ0_9PSEU|nr:beta-ketoacyl synthase N-terminal-like domain-containing protein [Amycolatopsis sp. HUAS 11-8]WAL63434.1 beta-ketoacyl synthase N-terminal-like domain-containing protein [Amycolatopsis sp. HUAS 11-8]